MHARTLAAHSRTTPRHPQAVSSTGTTAGRGHFAASARQTPRLTADEGLSPGAAQGRGSQLRAFGLPGGASEGATVLGRRAFLGALASLAAPAPALELESEPEALPALEALPCADRATFTPGNFFVWGYYDQGRADAPRAYENYAVMQPEPGDPAERVRLGMLTLYPSEGAGAATWRLHHQAVFDHGEATRALSDPFIAGAPSIEMRYWDGAAFRHGTDRANTSPVSEKFNLAGLRLSGMTTYADYDGLTVRNPRTTPPPSFGRDGRTEVVFQPRTFAPRPGVFGSYYGEDGVTRYKILNPDDRSSRCDIRLVFMSKGGIGRMMAFGGNEVPQLRASLAQFQNPAFVDYAQLSD